MSGTRRVANEPRAADELVAFADLFDAERARDLVARLAAEELTGRQAGTPGGARAGELLVALLASWGLAPRVQELAVEGVALLDKAPTLSFDGAPLEHRLQFAEHPRSAYSPDPHTGRAREAASAGAGDWAVL